MNFLDIFWTEIFKTISFKLLINNRKIIIWEKVVSNHISNKPNWKKIVIFYFYIKTSININANKNWQNK